MSTDSIKVYPYLQTSRKNKDGDCLIYIYILLNGAIVKMVSTKIYINQDFWDPEAREVKSRHSHANLYNDRIHAIKEEIKGKVYKAYNQGKITVYDIRAELAGKASKKGSVLAYMDEYIEYMRAPRKSGSKYRHGTLKNWNKERNRLKSYDPNVTFGGIDKKWLVGYEAFCAKELNATTSLPIAIRYLIQILRQAAENGLYDLTKIAGYRRPRYKDPQKNYLTLEQTDAIWKKIEDGDYDDCQPLRIIACYFLVECYSGLRNSDWGKFTTEKLIDTKGLKVYAKKTGAPLYIRLDNSPRLSKVIEYIQTNGLVYDYVLQYTNRMLNMVGKDLGLPFRLTTHVGRHTAATLMLEMGYSFEYVAEFLGVSIKTAQIYGKVTRVKLNREYEKLGGL